MKASKFTDAQMALIVKSGDKNTTVAEICSKSEISPATYFNWKKSMRGLMPSEMRRLHDLEHENNQMKRIVAGLKLDREKLQEAIKRKL